MKTKMIIAILFAIFGVVPQVNAETLQINRETGEFRVYEEDPWGPVTPLEKKAFEKPGTKISLAEKESMERSYGSFKEFFFGTPVTKVTEAIVVENGRLKKIDEPYIEKGEPKFLCYVPAVFSSICLMVIGGIAFLGGGQAVIFFSIFFCSRAMPILSK
jgi:hypothetical protein